MESLSFRLDGGGLGFMVPSDSSGPSGQAKGKGFAIVLAIP